MRVNLHALAGNMSAVYRIVFTGMLLFELVRYGLKKRKLSHAEVRTLGPDDARRRGGRSPGPSREKP